MKKLLIVLMSMLLLVVVLFSGFYGWKFFLTNRNNRDSGINEKKVIITDSFEEFSYEVVEVIKRYDDKKTLKTEDNDNRFYSRRLIVQGIKDIDLEGVGEEVLITGPEYIYVLQFANAADAEAVCIFLQDMDGVEYCEPDTYAHALSKSGNKEPLSWGMKRIGADVLSRGIYDSDGVTVAVVDSGVYSKHSLLEGRVLHSGYDFVDNDTKPEDEYQHGTHVAGIIVDCTPNLPISILPVRCLNEKGRGTALQIGLAIRYAANQNADVINLSLSIDDGTSKFVDQSVLYAFHRGSVVVASAGNDNGNTAEKSPAHLEEAFVVSAVDENLNKADFSNWGDSVDFAAPGVNITSTVPFLLNKIAVTGVTKEMDGTSMAAPHISALTAMIKLQNEYYTPDDIHREIRNHCIDLGESGWDQLYGYGFPDWNNIVEEPIQETEQIQTEMVEAVPETENRSSSVDLSAYIPILDEYKQLHDNKFDYKYRDAVAYANQGVWNFGGKSEDDFEVSVYYMINDLAGDNKPELLISFSDAYDQHFIMDIFSVDSGHLQAILENDASVGYRSRYHLVKPNRIKLNSSGGMAGAVRYYSYRSGSSDLLLEEEYVYDGWNNEEYRHKVEGFETNISESEYTDALTNDLDRENQWILLADGFEEVLRQYRFEEENETRIPDETEERNRSLGRVVTYAYQGIFARDGVYIGIQLYTSGDSYGIVGNVNLTSKPFWNNDGYIETIMLERLGDLEFNQSANSYYIVSNESKYEIIFLNKRIEVLEGPYKGVYEQVSNSGANMDRSQLWLSLPEDEYSVNESDQKPITVVIETQAYDNADYILPESSSIQLSEAQLNSLTSEQLRIARNEIFARHGRKFNSEDLQQYFGSKSWYVPIYSPEEFEKIQDVELSSIEWANVKLIQRMEEG